MRANSRPKGPTRDSRSVGLISSAPVATRLRVVHLGKYYPPSSGGIETHTQTLARAQIALGAEVRVVVINHGAADGRDVTFDRFAHTPSSRDMDGLIQIDRVGRWGNLAKLDIAPGLPAVLRQVGSTQPDIWHLHTPNVTMMLAVLASPSIRPLIVTHHSDIIRQRFLKYFVRPIEDAVYRRARRILPTSAAYIDGSDILKRYAGKLTPLPLGLDLTPFQDPSASAKAFADSFRKRFTGPTWLSVGRLIYYKGLNVALEALRSVSGTLVVIGTGPLESELKRRAFQLGVAERVVWHGRAEADELIGPYLAATAFWFPSVARSEGFGLVQVEAMAAGCPVINTAITGSGTAWVCPHEVAGLTVPVNDSAAFAAAARRILTEPGLRDRLVRGGRNRAIAEFDWMVMGKRSLDVYRSVLGV